MFSASIKDKSGTTLSLTGNEAKYQVINIIGLNPPRALVNTTAIAGMDGAVYNSARLETRNIVITVKINGDAEANRLDLYKRVKTKEPCTFLYSNGSRNVEIDGYVESVDCGTFSNSERAQISILCPDPYFRSATEISTQIAPTTGATVVNASESECGCGIDIDLANVGAGVLVTDITITNAASGEHITLDGTKMAAGGFQRGQKIFINTNAGKKSVRVLAGGVLENDFQTLADGSSLFQLQVGNNAITYTADGQDANVAVTVRHYNVYRGV